MELDAYLTQLQGPVESQGRFTWDLERMADVLQHYVLPDPEEYILHALASAVAGGSRRFTASSRGYCWDSPTFSHEDLQSLFHPQAQPRLRELALALLTARSLGEVLFETTGGIVTLTPSKMSVRPSDQTFTTNRLEVRRRFWRRWYGRRVELTMLRDRGCLAPLELNCARPGPPLLAEVALRVGSPPHEAVQSRHWLSPTENAWGDGFLALGRGLSQLVHNGVTYPFYLNIGSFVAVWWTSSLPLDSRGALVEGAEWSDWKRTLSQALLQGMLAWEGRSAYLDDLFALGRDIQEAPLFRRPHGSPATFAQVLQDQRALGFLPVVSRTGQPPWEPERTLLVGPEDKLPTQAVSLDHITSPVPLLPEPAHYLVRMPCEQGEMGLSLHPTLRSRVWCHEGWRASELAPHGLEMATALETAQPRPDVLRLYRCLAAFQPVCDQEDAFNFHVVSFLHWLAGTQEQALGHVMSSQGKLATLIQPGRVILMQGVKLTGEELEALSLKVSLRRQRGLRASLQQTRALQLYSYYDSCQSPETMVLTPDLAHLLEELMAPQCRFQLISVSPQTTECDTLLLGRRDLDPATVLAGILESDCSAKSILDEILGDLSPLQSALAQLEPSGGIDTVMHRALVRLGDGGVLATEHVLLALVDTAGPVRDLLAGLGVTRESLRQPYDRWVGKEALEPFEAFGYMLHLLRTGRFEEATRELPKTGFKQPILEGTLHALLGNTDAALEEFRAVDSQEGVAEALLDGGRTEEARATVAKLRRTGRALWLKARLADDPEETLNLCAEARRRSDCPLSIGEVEAAAYLQLGKTAEARRALEEFIDHTPDLILEPNIRQRQEQARARLTLLS